MDNLLDSFSLTIKIGTQKIKFTINTHQSTDEMFQKLKMIHPQCKNKKEETLNKLKHDLQNKLKTHNVKENIIRTIEYYLSKNFKEEQIVKSQRQNQTKMDSSLLTSQHVSFKTSPIIQKVAEKQETDSKKQSKSVIQNEIKEKPKLKQRTISVQRRTETLQKNKSQPKKQFINEDLVKAYQTILQKSTQVDIKLMARKCLEELGKLPQVERKMQPVISRKYEISVLVQKEAKTQQKQSKLQKHNKSPIQAIDLPSQNREKSNEQITEIAKSSETSPYPKLFVTNKYNYMPNNSHIIQQAKYNGGQLSLSYLGNTHVTHRKFNYLQNFM